MGDGTQNQDSTKDQILENIRLHKELLQSVKLQPWSMRRKLRLVRQVRNQIQIAHVLSLDCCIDFLFIVPQAKEYIALHEGALQERFAMSRSTKDLWARFKIVLAVVSERAILIAMHWYNHLPICWFILFAFLLFTLSTDANTRNGITCDVNWSTSPRYSYPGNCASKKSNRILDRLSRHILHFYDGYFGWTS